MYVPTSPTEKFILECSQNTVLDAWFQAAMQRSALLFCVKKLESLTHFYGCETWRLTLWEEYRLKVFKIWCRGKYLDLQGESTDCWKLHNEKRQ